MKTILVILFCITSSKCGVLKDDLKKSNVAACNRFESQLIMVRDTFDAGSIMLLQEILIDVTKDQEVRPTNIESVTKNYNLLPGMHKWELKFDSSQQSVDEIDRIFNIVEKTAKTTGQLVSKNSTTENDTVTWEFNINVEVTSQPLSKKHKREINVQPSKTEHRLIEVHLVRVMDSFEDGNVTLLTEIIIDVTKDQEGRPSNIESVTKDYHLQPGMHKWELKFPSSHQYVDETNHILSIVEKIAKTKGQLVSKNSTTENDTVTWEFNINVDVTSQPLSKKHKRQINAQPSETEHRLIEVHLVRVMDSFEDGNVTLLTEIIIDVTKDQEGRPSNIESITKDYHLQPGMHKWELKFPSSHQYVDETNRILSIVEKIAKTKGQLVSKNSTTENDTVTWEFNINVDVTSQPSSKKHKRDIEFQNNAQPKDIEEIKRILSFAEAAENKKGEADGKNCKTTDGVVICKVYIPNDSSKIHKRDIEFQNNTPPTDEDEIKEKPDIISPAANPTDIFIVDDNGNTCTATTTTTVDNKVYCLFATSTALVGGCPAGTDRADDNTCVPIV